MERSTRRVVVILAAVAALSSAAWAAAVVADLAQGFHDDPAERELAQATTAVSTLALTAATATMWHRHRDRPLGTFAQEWLVALAALGVGLFGMFILTKPLDMGRYEAYCSPLVVESLPGLGHQGPRCTDRGRAVAGLGLTMVGALGAMLVSIRRPEPEWPPSVPQFRGADGIGEPAFLLERIGPTRYRLEVPFTYWDPTLDERFVIPAPESEFTTDLGSIPRWFTWLVPGTGHHIPAMLVHDAMVLGPGEMKTYQGVDVTRVEADRILRDAMKHLGTDRLRRWLIWSAVAFATARTCRTPRWFWSWWPAVWALLIAGLGACMSVFLLTGWSGGLTDDVAWVNRAVIGVAAAVLVPLPLAVLWRGRPESGRIGIIGGWAIAWLLWPTALVLLAYGGYVAVEGFASRDEARPDTAPRRPLAPGLDKATARAAACSGESPPDTPATHSTG